MCVTTHIQKCFYEGVSNLPCKCVCVCVCVCVIEKITHARAHSAPQKPYFLPKIKDGTRKDIYVYATRGNATKACKAAGFAR